MVKKMTKQPSVPGVVSLGPGLSSLTNLLYLALYDKMYGVKPAKIHDLNISINGEIYTV